MPRVPHSTDDLVEAEEALQRAMLYGDADALEAFLDDEIVLVGATGQSSFKPDEVDAYRSGRRRLHRFEVERSRVRVLEELGLTFTTALVEGTVDGVPFSRRERHTRTWRLGDEWTVVASHASVVKPPTRP
jgi:hypothetical protein